MTPGGVLVSLVVNFELARLAEHQRLKIHETLATSPELRQHQESLPVSRDRAERARGRRRTLTCPGRLQGEEGETSESWCSVRSGGGVERKQNLGQLHVREGTSEGFYIVCNALLYSATLTFNSSGNWSLKSTFSLMPGDQEETRSSFLRGAFM